MPEVSVIIPVYNVEEYLDRCLESVAEQTFSDIEIVLVDDGSTDGSGKKCLEWAKSDKRIIYIYKKNEGAGPARNLGIQAASSELTAFCDPDDWYDERFIELMLAKHRETGADVVVCGYNNYDGNLSKVKSSYTYASLEGVSRYWAWGVIPGFHIKLFRRSFLIDNDIKMPNCLGQDTAIHHYIMIKANKVALVNQALYYYWFNRQGSAVNNYLRHTSNTVQRLIYGWELFIRDGIFEEHKKQLLYTTAVHINQWYRKIANDVEYSKKWLIDCTEAIMRYFDEKMVRAYMYSVCAIGSYSLFNSISPGLPDYTECDKESINEYCFTGLISYTSDKPADPPEIDNPFRQKALDNDFNKGLIKWLINKQYDYIILDFLDERFDIAEFDGGYYTISDVFLESDISFTYKTIKRGEADTVNLWKAKCSELIKILKTYYTADKVILVKNFLAETFGIVGNMRNYDNLDDLRHMNAVIADCYDFFEKSFTGVEIIDLSESGLVYSDENFRHGCAPWHYNQGYYVTVRSRIAELITQEYIRQEQEI